MIRWWPRAASSAASASPMFCDAPVTTARASALGAGTGMRRTISWADHERAALDPARAVAGPRVAEDRRRGRCGTSASTGLNAIVVTFVFSVYLTDAVGDDLPGGASPTSWLGSGAGASAGLVVAAVRAGHRGVGATRRGGGAARWPCSPRRRCCWPRR